MYFGTSASDCGRAVLLLNCLAYGIKVFLAIIVIPSMWNLLNLHAVFVSILIRLTRTPIGVRYDLAVGGQLKMTFAGVVSYSCPIIVNVSRVDLTDERGELPLLICICYFHKLFSLTDAELKKNFNGKVCYGKGITVGKF